MNILSLFDGMSCGHIALDRANIKVEKYYASEIKKHAIELVKKQYPKTIHLGDVTKINSSLLPRIDLLIGGFPCKGISKLNQNQDGLEHIESKLFYEYVRLWKELNPKYFLLENTRGNKEALTIVTEIMGVEPIMINSRLVSAQNRPRLYWTNIPNIVLPIDKNITTKDIFDDDMPEDVLITPGRLKWILGESGKRSIEKQYTKINPYPKAGCITAGGHRKWNENYLLKDGKYRYLKISEIEKLQTVPVGYTSSLSYNDAYDVLGDGWTIDVISHIFSFLPNEYKENTND